MSAHAPASPRRQDNLAGTLQEVLTVVERLRSNRQPVTDLQAFRQQVRDALRNAEQQARTLGYSGDQAQLAVFAVVAFLDETVLNLQEKLPVFRDWHRQPLQEEMYGHHIAGEVFFQHLQKLLAADDSAAIADVLEVYQLCLLLGFAGRYSLGQKGELSRLTDLIGSKIQRVRQTPAELSPDGALPPEPPPKTGADPWVRRLVVGAAACVLLAVGLYAGYAVSLRSGVAQAQSMAAR